VTQGRILTQHTGLPPRVTGAQPVAKPGAQPSTAFSPDPRPFAKRKPR
jgi:hypothetical protein